MSEDPLDTMSSALPEAVNYHRWILSLCQPHVRGSLLEVGFGYGQYTRVLANWAERVTAIDLNPACLDAQSDLPGNVELRIVDLLSASACDLLRPASFDSAVILNVLEHIPDHEAALGQLARLLRPGGRLLIYVPAHMALYGALDELAGHKRRYSIRSLGALVQRAGLRLLRCEYVNPLGGLGWLINARLARPESLSDPAINRQIRLYDRFVLPFSRLLTPLSRGVFGQSVWCVAER